MKNHFSDMNAGVKEFFAYHEQWLYRRESEPAWESEFRKYRDLFCRGEIEDFLFLTLDDPVLFLAFFEYERNKGLRWDLVHTSVCDFSFGDDDFEEDFNLAQRSLEFWRMVIELEANIPLGETNLYDAMILEAYRFLKIKDLTVKERDILLRISLQESYIPFGKKALAVGRYEVTRLLGYAVEKEIRRQGGMLRPYSLIASSPTVAMTGVSWYDCIAFCNALSEKMGLEPFYDLRISSKPFQKSVKRVKYIKNSNGYRLLSVKTWKKVGSHDTWDFNPLGVSRAQEFHGVHVGNKFYYHAVGQKDMNKYQLFDTIGNVGEWSSTVTRDKAYVLGSNTIGYWRDTREEPYLVAQDAIGPSLGLRVCRNVPLQKR